MPMKRHAAGDGLAQAGTMLAQQKLRQGALNAQPTPSGESPMAGDDWERLMQWWKFMQSQGRIP